MTHLHAFFISITELGRGTKQFPYDVRVDTEGIAHIFGIFAQTLLRQTCTNLWVSRADPGIAV